MLYIKLGNLQRRGILRKALRMIEEQDMWRLRLCVSFLLCSAAEGIDCGDRLTRCLDGSHIGLRTSRTQPNFTGSWQGARPQ